MSLDHGFAVAPSTHRKSPEGNSPGESESFAWRSTWPIGPNDDFVADLQGGGFARLHLQKTGIRAGEWTWTVCVDHDRRSGHAPSREAAVEAAERALRPG